MTRLCEQIASVRVEVVWDEYEWSGYCLKQVPHHSQVDAHEKFNTGLFNHNGLTKKSIIENEEDLQMRLTKNAVITDINQSRLVDAVRLSTDEMPSDRTKKMNEVKKEIERRVRQNKDLTIVIVE